MLLLRVGKTWNLSFTYGGKDFLPLAVVQRSLRPVGSTRNLSHHQDSKVGSELPGGYVEEEVLFSMHGGP